MIYSKPIFYFQFQWIKEPYLNDDQEAITSHTLVKYKQT